MSNLNILIVEGNIREDSEFFIKAAGASAADNLKNSNFKNRTINKYRNYKSWS